MKDSKCIVAINTDPDSPIFQVCHPALALLICNAGRAFAVHMSLRQACWDRDWLTIEWLGGGVLQVADYGLVMDIFEAISALKRELQKTA
jgi:hypothetical protein